ncbi:MAG: hypothetical protein AAFV32_00910 [Myxococcota bacterium]
MSRVTCAVFLCCVLNACGETFIEVEARSDTLVAGSIDNVVFEFLETSLGPQFESRTLNVSELPLFVIFESEASVPNPLWLNVEARRENQIVEGRLIEFEYEPNEVNRLTVLLIAPE